MYFGNGASACRMCGEDLLRCYPLGPELAAGSAVGGTGEVHEHLRPVHQSPGHDGTAKRGVGHHDRESACAGRRTACRQGRTLGGPGPACNSCRAECVAAGDRGFFCDYVLDYLATGRHQQGSGGTRRLPHPHKKQAWKGQDSVKLGDRRVRQPDARRGGQRDERHQALVEPPSRHGDGQQSHLSIQRRRPPNGAAAAVVAGPTARARSSRCSPPRRRSKWAWASTINCRCRAQSRPRGLGSSDTPGCPKETWCVKNAGNYRGSMNVIDACGHVTEHRLREIDSAGGSSACRRHGGLAGAAGRTALPRRAPHAARRQRRRHVRQLERIQLERTQRERPDVLPLDELGQAFVALRVVCPRRSGSA